MFSDSPELLFETPRLFVRRLTEGDIEELFAVYGDADAMRFVGDGEPLSREGCAEWVEVTRRNDAIRGYGMTALALKETGEIVGFCGLVHPGGQQGTELKYALKRAFWGRGLATEAARAMLDYGVQAFGLSKIIATIYPENRASERVLVKAGMSFVEDRSDDDGTITRVFARSPAPIAPTKRVLFVCGKNRWRSPTAEQVFATFPGVECASAGLSRDAENPLAPELVEWAELIFVMEKAHQTKLNSRFKTRLAGKKIVCLNIPDDYRFMEPTLIALLQSKVTPYLL